MTPQKGLAADSGLAARHIVGRWIIGPDSNVGPLDRQAHVLEKAEGGPPVSWQVRRHAGVLFLNQPTGRLRLESRPNPESDPV